MRRILFVFLCCLCVNGFAERLLISGKPTKLVANEGNFSFPDGYIQRGKYHFITLAGLVQVCYIPEMPQLKSLPSMFLIFEENGLKIRWNCYTYDPNYFELDY